MTKIIELPEDLLDAMYETKYISEDGEFQASPDSWNILCIVFEQEEAWIEKGEIVIQLEARTLN